MEFQLGNCEIDPFGRENETGYHYLNGERLQKAAAQRGTWRGEGEGGRVIVSESQDAGTQGQKLRETVKHRI